MSRRLRRQSFSILAAKREIRMKQEKVELETRGVKVFLFSVFCSLGVRMHLFCTRPYFCGCTLTSFGVYVFILSTYTFWQSKRKTGKTFSNKKIVKVMDTGGEEQ